MAWKIIRRSKKRHLITRTLLALVLIPVLIPLAVTFLYSFFSPAEIKAFLDSRGSYAGSAFMEVLLFPKTASISQYYTILIKDMSVLRMCAN